MEIINLVEYKNKKKVDTELSPNRTPLYVSRQAGKISGSQAPESEDFGSRLARIRASLDKINCLMAELKQMNTETSPNVR